VLLAKNYDSYSYFNEAPQFFLDALGTWGSWFISFSNFIPISLLVTLEVVRFGQGKIVGIIFFIYFKKMILNAK
jgi:hypothetical protein